MVTIVKENGTSDTDTCTWNKIDKINNSDVDYAYVNVSPAFNLQMKDEVSLLDVNQNEMFGGYVRSIKNQLLKECIVFGYDILLSDIEIQKNFESYSPEGIIQYCVEEAGLVYVSTISSGLTIPLYPAKDKKLKDVINDMHSILGTVGKTDKDKNYTLEYPGASFNSTTLQIGQNCELENGWNLDTDNLCTQVKVIGAIENIIAEPVLFNGTGSQTEYELATIFTSIKVEVDSGSGFIEQTPQISGVQSGDYEISKEIKKFVFQSGSIPSVGTGNIRVTYDYDREITYTEASEIIESDKSNLHQKTVKREYLKTIEDVEAFASDYLTKYSTPLISGTIKSDNINISNFEINQSIQVIDNTRKIDGNFVNKTLIIKRLVREFGSEGASLLIEVGESTEFGFNRGQEQEYRLKQLEENVTTAELLQFGAKTTDSITMQFDSDITDIEKRTFASDTFYLEENSSGTRNQMKEDGTGPVMREAGYTSEDVTGSDDVRVTQDNINDRVTMAGDTRVTMSHVEADTSSIITSIYQNGARDNFFTQLITDMSHIAVGDDNTAPVIGDTGLGNETYIKAVTVTQTGLNLVSKATLTTTENNSNNVKELGLFDAASGGNLYLRDLTTVIAKDSDTEIRLSNILTVNTTNEDL